MKRLGVGLLGLGEVAQLMHLPVLRRLHDRFDVVAVHDVSPSVLHAVAERCSIPGRHATAAELVADPAVDVVFVLSPDQHHAEQAQAALAAGKHVFVEKPACLELEGLSRLVAAHECSGRVAMVGYMRRFAPAFLAAKAELSSLGPLRYVRVRDLICEGPWFYRQAEEVAVPSGDIPGDLVSSSRALRGAMMDAACGTLSSPDLRKAYEVMTGLSSHSLSAMRDLLGVSPRRVVAAHVSQGGTQLVAILDYGDFTALYECLIDDVVRFDAGFDLYSADKRMSFRYETPYVRDQPMFLEIQESTAGTNEVRRVGPFLKDPFQVELEALHDAIVSNGPNRTPPSDSKADLELFREILEAASRSALA